MLRNKVSYLPYFEVTLLPNILARVFFFFVPEVSKKKKTSPGNILQLRFSLYYIFQDKSCLRYLCILLHYLPHLCRHFFLNKTSRITLRLRYLLYVEIRFACREKKRCVCLSCINLSAISASQLKVKVILSDCHKLIILYVSVSW